MNIRKIFYLTLFCFLFFRLDGVERALAGVMSTIKIDTVTNVTTPISGNLLGEAVKSNLLEERKVESLQNEIKRAEEDLRQSREVRSRITNSIGEIKVQIDALPKIDFLGLERDREELKKRITSQKKEIMNLKDRLSNQQDQLEKLNLSIKKEYPLDDLDNVIQNLWDDEIQYLDTALADMDIIELDKVEYRYQEFQDLGLKAPNPSKRIEAMKKLLGEYQRARILLTQAYTKSDTYSYYTLLSSSSHKEWKRLRDNRFISVPQYDEIYNTLIALSYYTEGVYVLNNMIQKEMQQSYFTSPDDNIQYDIDNYINPIPYLHDLFERYRTAWKNGRTDEIEKLNNEISKLAKEL